jgi:predicted nuclease of predicted toxin-antitoxin system
MGAGGGVKLLLDENLSRRLVPLLQADFPGTTQVALVGLERADDRAIREFAAKQGFVIVTKDDDFNGLLALFGYPPKVIHLRVGNCSNEHLARLLSTAKTELEGALECAEVGSVEIG